jgi:hypothetical protein
MKRWTLGRLQLPTLWLTLSLGVGCGKSEPTSERALTPDPSQAAPGPATPDRLPPGELLEGEARAFGLPLPRQMKLEAITKRVAHARGEVSSAVLADYLRQRVLAQHVELAERKLVFPQVQLRGDPKRTMLRLELIDEGLTTHLIVENLMGPPPIEGLTDEQHWKRAGMTPDGKLIDPQKLE